MAVKFQHRIYLFKFKVMDIAPEGRAGRNVVGFEISAA